MHYIYYVIHNYTYFYILIYFYCPYLDMYLVRACHAKVRDQMRTNKEEAERTDHGKIAANIKDRPTSEETPRSTRRHPPSPGFWQRRNRGAHYCISPPKLKKR